MRARIMVLFVVLLFSCEHETVLTSGNAESGLELAVPAAYPTIQAAIDAAKMEDTVLVAPGDYYENVTIAPGIILKGCGPDKTVLHGHISTFGSDGTTVLGFRVTAEGAPAKSPDAGILIDGEIFLVSGNVVEGFASGIMIDSTVDGEISGNVIRKNLTGIKVVESADVRIFNNVVSHNSDSGIAFMNYTEAKVFHNTLVGNGFAKPYEQGGAGLVIGSSGSVIARNNIVVSNKGGVNLMVDPTTVNHHNLVWGNVDNYVGNASAGAGDKCADPLFRNPAEKDYSLLSASPAIDAGLDLGLTLDFAGKPRLAGAAPDLGAFEIQPQTADLLISEVMANPLDEARGEFVELHNPTATAIDAAGLVLDDGDAIDALIGYKGGPTLVPGGGYAVVLDPDYATGPATYDIPPAAVLLTVPNASLGSGLSVSDQVSISRGGVVVSTYLHPFDPGNGISAERIDSSAPDVPGNWAPCSCAASPGKVNCLASGGGPKDLPTLVITEVMASPAIQTEGEFVEVFNFGSEPVQLAGLGLTDGDATDVLVKVAGKESLLPGGAHGLIVDQDLVPKMAGPPYQIDALVPYVVTVGNAALGDGLSKNDPVTLLAGDGKTPVTTYSHPVVTSLQSVERVDPLDADVPANWIPSPCAAKHSAGRPNCAYGGGAPVKVPVLLINEVMANPLDEDRGEFVEIYNPTDKAVDVAGLVLSDGSATDVIGPFAAGGSTTIPAKGYGVVLDPEYQGGYTIPASAVLLAPGNTSLGNGLATTDPVTLLAADGVTKISTYSFPFNPGNGVSVERKGGSGDTPGNWVASTCQSGSSPGAANCSSGPSKEEGGLVISEVMSNPLDESTGEFIEVVNTSEQAVNMAGYILSDGDASDVLQGFGGGSTVLQPGGYALVLDPDYPAGGPYAIPGGVVRLTTGDHTLGNGLATEDPVYLVAPDGITLVSTYLTPFNPGNGLSAERVDLKGAEAPEKWVKSPCKSGSSPGAPNCAAGEPVKPGVTVVDVNQADAAALQQVTGIGPVVAEQIVAYRGANGEFESLLQLCAMDTVTPAVVALWQVAEEGEAPFVLGLEGAKEVKVFDDVAQLLASLPDPGEALEAASWVGVPVRIQRATVFTEKDSQTNATLKLGDIEDVAAYVPKPLVTVTLVLGTAPGQANYDRSHTAVVDAVANWKKEDGDPFLLPLFYRWAGVPYGWGKVQFGATFSVEGVMEISAGAWRIRVRAGAESGADRLVQIERWIPAESWQKLDVVWTYEYTPVVVTDTANLTATLPYRLALAHPARAKWLEAHGQVIDVPRCSDWGSCYPMSVAWNLFNQALLEWKQVPGPKEGYCFTYSGTGYCFTPDESAMGVGILNNATFSQLTKHCYSTTLANLVIANRPFESIAQYDAVPGVGEKSLWNLLVCYVHSGDWPEAAEGSVLKVLKGTPGNAFQVVTVDEAVVTWKSGKNSIVCDPGTTNCIHIWIKDGPPPTLSVGDTVTVRGEVLNYGDGEVQYWEIEVNAAGHYCLILKEG